MSAPPGLKFVTDLPAAAAWIGDVHDVSVF
jgi:hypothetical protein